MLRALQRPPGSSAALVDEQGSLSFEALLAAVRFRAAVLFSAVLREDAAGGLCVYGDAGFHVLATVLAAAGVLGCRVLVASPTRMPPSELAAVMREAGVAALVAQAGLRDALALLEPCFHLDTGLPRSLLGDPAARDTDMELLYAGRLAVPLRLPPEPPPPPAGCLIFAEAEGLLWSTVSNLCGSGPLQALLRPGALVCGARSSLARPLGVALLLQTLVRGATYSLREADLETCAVAHLFGGSESLSGEATVVCEPPEQAELERRGVRHVQPIALSHSLECGPLEDLYEVEGHSVGGHCVCPAAALLLAALRLGSLSQFLYSRVRQVSGGDALRICRAGGGQCSLVLAGVDGGEVRPLGLFCVSALMGKAELRVPDWCTDETVAGPRGAVAELWAQLEARGLRMSPAFQGLEGEVDTLPSGCRVRLRRETVLGAELLQSILLAPLLLTLPLRGPLLVPRRIAAASVASDAAVPTRCFVRRIGERRFDVVAIDANVRAVMLLEGIEFDTVPEGNALFGVAWKSVCEPVLLEVRARGSVFCVAESEAPLLFGETPLVRYGSWKQAAALQRSDAVTVVVVASQWPLQSLVGRLQSLRNAVVITQIEQAPPQAQLWALARVSRGLRVVDTSLGEAGLLEAVLVSRHPVLMQGRGVRELVPRTAAAGAIDRPKQVAVVGSGAVAESVAAACAGLLMDAADDSRMAGMQAAVMCPRSWTRCPELATVTASLGRLPAGCHGVVLLPARSLLAEHGVSLQEAAVAEYCLAAGRAACALLSGPADVATALQVALTEGSVCSAPAWAVEESAWRAQQQLLEPPLAAVAALLPPLPREPAFAVNSASLCHVVGWSTRLSTVACPFLAERHRWDPEALPARSAPSPQRAALTEVAWSALEEALGGGAASAAVPGHSAVLACAAVGADGEAAALAKRLGFAERLGSDSCSLRALQVAAELLARRDEAAVALVAACGPWAEEMLPSEPPWYLLQCRAGRSRPFNAHSGGWCRAEGAAAIVLARQGRGVAVKRFVSAKKFRSLPVTNYAGVAFAETAGSGASDCDVAEMAALRRSLLKTQRRGEALVLGAGQGVVGHTGCAAGLVAVLRAAAALQPAAVAPRWGWFTELNPNISAPEDGCAAVLPLEDVPLRAVLATACAVSPDGAVMHVTLRCAQADTRASLPEVGGVVGVALVAPSSRALQLLLRSCVVQTEQALPPSARFLPRGTGLRHALAVWGTSPKALAAGYAALQAVPPEELRATTPGIVWLAFSPCGAGLAAASQELLVGGCCSPAAQCRAQLVSEVGPCTELLRFQTLVFDWLTSVVALEQLNLLAMGGVTSRNAVAALAPDDEAFRQFVAACGRDDAARRRLSKRVCVVECFAGLSAVKEALARLARGAVLHALLLGPQSTAVVLRRAKFAAEAVALCREAAIRCAVGRSASDELLWAPAHRAAPVLGFRLPASARLHDLAVGWGVTAASPSLASLWTEPRSAAVPWSTEALDAGALVIDLGPLTARSIGMLLKKASRVECISVFARRSTPLAFLNLLSLRCELMPRQPCAVFAAPPPFVRSAQLLGLPAFESTVGECSWQSGHTCTFEIAAATDSLEEVWRCVVVRHPLLRTVRAKDDDAAASYPPRVAAWWDGLASDTKLDQQCFPRFCVSRRQDRGATVCLDGFGLSEDSAAALMHDLRLGMAGQELAAPPVVLDAQSYAWIKHGPPLSDEAPLETHWGWHAGVHSLETVIACVARLCAASGVAVLSRSHHCLGTDGATARMRRTMPGVPRVFCACLCGCGAVRLDARHPNGAALLSTLCAALTGEGRGGEGEPLHEVVARPEACVPLVHGHATAGELRSRATWLCEVLAAVGCRTGDAVAVVSESLLDHATALLAASRLGLALQQLGAHPLSAAVVRAPRVCLTDRRHMYFARGLGCVVMIADLVSSSSSASSSSSSSSSSDAEEPMPTSSVCAVFLDRGGRAAGEGSLSGLARRLAAVLGLTRDDMVLCADGQCGPLQLLAAAWAAARVTATAADASVAIVDSCSLPSAPCLGVRAAAVVGATVSGAELARAFPTCRCVIRIRDNA